MTRSPVLLGLLVSLSAATLAPPAAAQMRAGTVEVLATSMLRLEWTRYRGDTSAITRYMGGTAQLSGPVALANRTPLPIKSVEVEISLVPSPALSAEARAELDEQLQHRITKSRTTLRLPNVLAPSAVVETTLSGSVRIQDGSGSSRAAAGISAASLDSLVVSFRVLRAWSDFMPFTLAPAEESTRSTVRARLSQPCTGSSRFRLELMRSGFLGLYQQGTCEASIEVRNGDTRTIDFVSLSSTFPIRSASSLEIGSTLGPSHLFAPPLGGGASGTFRQSVGFVVPIDDPARRVGGEPIALPLEVERASVYVAPLPVLLQRAAVVRDAASRRGRVISRLRRGDAVAEGETARDAPDYVQVTTADGQRGFIERVALEITLGRNENARARETARGLYVPTCALDGVGPLRVQLSGQMRRTISVGERSMEITSDGRNFLRHQGDELRLIEPAGYTTRDASRLCPLVHTDALRTHLGVEITLDQVRNRTPATGPR